MPVVCPTVLAADERDFHAQIDKVKKFAKRIQIDLTDGQFASSPTIAPELVSWPEGIEADIHLMYENPILAVEKLIAKKPNLLIAHVESDVDFQVFSKLCHDNSIKTGAALLAHTPAQKLESILSLLDHVLIFSGVLGEFGGSANLDLLNKVSYLKGLKPEVEIDWDGGINDQNVAELVNGGVDVLAVGGYIQKAGDPERAFKTLQRIADETGTT